MGDREGRNEGALNYTNLELTDQARIALLEGQRRSAENLKVDLLRRVKMLEFALRQERCVLATAFPAL